MSSQSDQLEHKLKRFIYETAARKGRRLGRTLMIQFRVPAPDKIGPGVDMNHYQPPKGNMPLTDAQDIAGVEQEPPYPRKRVSPQSTGNFISSIREEDNVDTCLKTLSGSIQVDVGTNISARDYSMSAKGASWSRVMKDMQDPVPWSRVGDYNRNLKEYVDFGIENPWYENWDKIAKSNIKRIIR